MTTSVAEAQLRADAAKARLAGTVGELQERLHPRALVRDATQGIAESADKVARAGLESVRDNPGKAAGVVAVAIAFLARGQIARLVQKRKRNHDD